MNKIIIISILTVVMLTACNRDFDAPNPNSLTISDFWETENDAIKGVNAVYSTLRRQASTYSRWMHFHRILRSDEGFGSGGDIGFNNLLSFVQTDYNAVQARESYQNSYVGVYRANQALANIPGINMDANLKKRLIAEAKFMRGFFYFDLTLFWGRPPLLLEPSKPTDQPRNATNEEAWAQVIKDFTEAAVDLPETYPATDVGRATKGAAYAFIGKAYMQQNKYQQAVDALNWLVEGPGKSIYGLVDNYRDNFLINTENNKESVFEIQFAYKQNENGDNDASETINLNTGASLPKFFSPGAPNIGFNDGAARRRWLIDTFLLEKTAANNRDPRLGWSFLFDSSDERGPNFTMAYAKTFATLGVPNASTGMWFRKMLNDDNRNFESFSSGNNYRMVRYADILLLYAEALNGVGRTADAYQYVNRVRQRPSVAMSPLPTGMSQARFLIQIKHERVVELSGEGWRWADLLRWNEFQNNLPVLKARDSEFNNFQLNRNEYYPIPQRDIDINPNLTQNLGFN